MCFHPDEACSTHPPHEDDLDIKDLCKRVQNTPPSYVLWRLEKLRESRNVDPSKAELISRYTRSDFALLAEDLYLVQCALNDPGFDEDEDFGCYDIVRQNLYSVRRIRKELQQLSKELDFQSNASVQKDEALLRNLEIQYEQIAPDVRDIYNMSVSQASLKESRKSIEMAERSIQESERVKLRK